MEKPLFDRNTHDGIKIRDRFKDTFIFALPKGEIRPTDTDKVKYSKAMSKGDLVAYRMKDVREYRKPNTDEKLESTTDFRFLSEVPVGEDLNLFYSRIEKILNPAASDVLKAHARGIEKLATLNIGGSEEKTEGAAAAHPEFPEGVITYRGEPLTKMADGYFRFSEAKCTHCHHPIPLKSKVTVKDGEGKSQYNKVAVNGDADRVEGKKYLWEHHMCRDKHNAELERQKQKDAGVEPDQETSKEAGKKEAASPLTLREIDRVLELLTGTQTDGFKVAYLTGYFQREKDAQEQ